jgi:hypothetical protein
MEQKFVSFEEAVSKLNISPERLNELRESNALRSYRDGSSWKFRADEIEKFVSDGIPDLPPPSDISLIDSSELVDAEPLDDFNLDEDLGLGLADLAELELDDDGAPEPDQSAIDLKLSDTDAMSAGSELELAGLEDTVTAGGSDLSLDLPEDGSDPTDSILLSEEELGESVGSLSTIIGRKELDLPDADLEFADDVTDEEDTKLSSSSGASDVLSSQVAGSGVLDEMEDLSDAKKAFKDLEELEIDLAAESSLALNPADVADVRAKGKSLTKGDSDLKLGDDDEEVGDEGNMGSTDVPLEELAAVGTADDDDADMELELAGDDDLILADAGGSDITLDSGDSGINLISPSDSGLALDDIPLDVGGSAILSSLSLEGSDPEISLLGGDSNIAAASGAALQTDDDFQLTPLSEGGLDDGDSSSQVIALDADLGGFADAGSAGLLDEGFPADDEGVVLTEDFAEAPGEGGFGMDPYAAPVAVGSTAEVQYGPGAIALLTFCGLFMALGSFMMIDMIRNIWSWDENYAVNSSLLDALLGMFGLS